MATSKTKEDLFTKEQIVNAKRFSENKDLVNGLLTDGELYSFSQVEKMIQKYKKGTVK